MELIDRYANMTGGQSPEMKIALVLGVIVATILFLTMLQELMGRILIHTRMRERRRAEAEQQRGPSQRFGDNIDENADHRTAHQGIHAESRRRL